MNKSFQEVIQYNTLSQKIQPFKRHVHNTTQLWPDLEST